MARECSFRILPQIKVTSKLTGFNFPEMKPIYLGISVYALSSFKVSAGFTITKIMYSSVYILDFIFGLLQSSALAVQVL